jgi:dTDP-4-dehydrorhamnose reductase
MTNVDQCAREPGLAMARNGEATRVLAEACRSAGIGLLVVSTNEVFDGGREDGLGYAEDDEPSPRNPYGASKLAGEIAAREAFDDGPGLWVARTAWLYGPPGNDFPDKIVAAADRTPPGEAVPVVADEFGSPTRTADLARAILELMARTDGGVFHLVARGHASRLEWAKRVLSIRRPGRAVRPISRTEFPRASDPPPWGVLATSRADAVGVRLPDWQTALDEHLRSSAGAEGSAGQSQR